MRRPESRRRTPDKSRAVTLLRWARALLPGDYLKTTWYLNFIAKPRKALRLLIHGFYRMDHVYDVLRQARDSFQGRFSILEFGTNEGYGFVKLLYAVKYLGMSDRVTVHGFDTFEGMPGTDRCEDRNIVFDDLQWTAGQFHGGYDELDEYCRRRYSNFRLHKGTFDQTLTTELLENFETESPILVWIDCDYYSSARSALERLVCHLPTGCVVYFDEYEFNYGSRFTGEARVVHELNQGLLGNGIELVLDRALSLSSNRVYRFVRFSGGPRYRRLGEPARDVGRSPTGGSPLP